MFDHPEGPAIDRPCGGGGLEKQAGYGGVVRALRPEHVARYHFFFLRSITRGGGGVEMKSEVEYCSLVVTSFDC